MLSDTLEFIKVDLSLRILYGKAPLKSSKIFHLMENYIGGGKGRTDGSAAFSRKGRSPCVHQAECAGEVPFLRLSLYAIITQMTSKNCVNNKKVINSGGKRKRTGQRAGPLITFLIPQTDIVRNYSSTGTRAMCSSSASAQASYPSQPPCGNCSLFPLCLLSPPNPLTLGFGGGPEAERAETRRCQKKVRGNYSSTGTRAMCSSSSCA